MTTRIAALDLGTNTFLCLLAEGQNGKINRIHKDLAEVVRLGQDVAKTGLFHSEALARAESCLQKFSEEIKSFKAEKVLAVATSAARDVKNGNLLFQLGRKYGIPIDIIDGEEEARTSFSGATFGLADSAEPLLVIDIGGGSTELIVGQTYERKVQFAKSLNIGGVRLTEKYISAHPVSRQNQEELVRQIKSELQLDLPTLKNLQIKKAIAVAGTPTSIAALELGGFDEKKVDGFYLSIERLKYWQKVFSETSIQEKQEKFQLGKRADIIYAGTAILCLILETLNLSGVSVSTKGVRYGVALKIMGS